MRAVIPSVSEESGREGTTKLVPRATARADPSLALGMTSIPLAVHERRVGPFVGPLIRMRAEEIALRLDQILRK